jgi:carboxyl-terminal processing protease
MMRRGTVLAFALGALCMQAAHSWWPEGEAEAARLSLNRAGFDAALRTVLDRYVDPVEASPVLAESLKRIVSGLDSYSHFLTAEDRQQIRDRSRGGTTGMAMKLHRAEAGSRKPAWVEVTAVLPDSPAQRANLHPGDQLLKIRGQDVAFLLSQAEAEALLLGGDGETIALTVQRRSEPAPAPVELVLAGQPKNLVDGTLVERGGQKFAHLRVRAFRGGTADLVKRDLKELRRAAGPSLVGVVLDLRGNPGGDVPEAVMIADLFVSEGVLVRTRGRGGQILREERAHPDGSDCDMPLVVLQDHGSASASELLAVALQDHGRARVVGERSFGKGTVQDVIGMHDGSQLTLTIARYFSPTDRLIDGNGVEPDLLSPVGVSAGTDAGLEAALAELVRSPGTTAPTELVRSPGTTAPTELVRSPGTTAPTELVRSPGTTAPTELLRSPATR